VIDQVSGDLYHAPGIAGRAGPARLARKGDQVVVTAVFASRTSKTSGQDSAIELLSEIPFDIPGKSRPRRIARQGEEGFEVRLHQLGEHPLGRSAAPVEVKRTTLARPVTTLGSARIRDRFHSPEATLTRAYKTCGKFQFRQLTRA
jgi:hypothetical protein